MVVRLRRTISVGGGSPAGSVILRRDIIAFDFSRQRRLVYVSEVKSSQSF